ncbi:ATP-binding protein [Myxococcus sp. K38C18041901]|uniref:sensor histidine kinase n=1 Tax=Myxococcus guangdongensis TaxID=2906760 RepID=UPI0020A71C72|nr:ATP-binding protein [Myxococcus guangdongensis]MCP3064173.1 ATP-binding protein [Myxococcus guangdongensis]
MHVRPPRNRSFWAPLAGRYGVAILSWAAACFVLFAGRPYAPTAPFLFFLGAVMVAGWWGGWGPALLTMVLSLGVVDLFYLEPLLDLMPGAGGAISIAAFVVLALLTTKLSVLLRSAREERSRLLVRELDARHEAEAERARLHSLFTDAPGCIILLQGPRHVFSFSNVMNDTMMGKTGLVGMEVRQALPWAEERGFVALLDEVYRTGIPYRGDAVSFPRTLPDGTVRETFLNLVYQPTRGEDGQVNGIAGFGFDVTEQVLARQKAETLTREIQAAKARDLLMAESGAVLASSLDVETVLRNMAKLVVPTFADWCFVDLVEEGDYRRLEVAHQRPAEDDLARVLLRHGLYPEGHPEHAPTLPLLKGEPLHVESLTPGQAAEFAHDAEHLRVIREVGAVSVIGVPLMARGEPLGVFSFIYAHSGRHYTSDDLVFAKELARRVSLSLENVRLYREAQEAVRLRDEFMSIASHELKTPLTPLKLKLQALSRELNRHPGPIPREVVTKYLEVGDLQIKKLTELVDELLDVSRIASGRLSLDLQRLELAPIVREVVTQYELQARRAGSTLELDVGTVPFEGDWDRLRLEQVVMNLVDNAVKYGRGNPIQVQLVPVDGGVHLVVRDGGIGIAPESLPRLFGRFERAVSERNYGGLGLGLYITRMLVEAMGGRVHVESTLGVGSTFTVELLCHPLERDAGATAALMEGAAANP